jgi:hypothetical protein
MEVGEYQVWLTDEQGRITERLFSRVSRTRAPLIGEGLFRDGGSYRVRDVWHFDEKSKRALPKKYSYPIVIVQKTAEPAPTGPSTGEDSLPSIGRAFPRRGGSANVLTLVPPTRAGETGLSRNLLGLIAVLVACGYRAQADQLNAAKQLSWELIWSGKSWVLQHLGGDAASPDELHQLSRYAVEQFRVATSVVESFSQEESGRGASLVAA